MSKIVKQLDPTSGLIAYIDDLKPYHSKILEVLIEYAHKDHIEVVIKDDFKLEESVYFYKPQYFANHGLRFNWEVDQCDDTVNVGDGTAKVKTPSSTKDFLQYPVTTPHAFIVLGDFSKIFKVGQTISLSLWQNENGTRFLPDGVTPGTHTQTVTINTIKHIPEKIDYSVTSTDISTKTDGDKAHTVITVAEAIPTFTPVAGKSPEGVAVLTPIDILRLDGSRSFVLSGNHTERFTQGYRFEVINGSDPGVFTAYSSAYNATLNETTILTTKYITDIPANWQRGQITGKRFGYDKEHGICSNVTPGTHARVSIEDQMVINDWGFNFKDTLLVHNMENDEVVPYAMGGYNNSSLPEVYGQYDAVPHLVHHEYVEVKDGGKSFKIGGGNYIDRFSFVPHFDVSRMGNDSGGFSLEFHADRLGIKQIDPVTKTITIYGKYDWLFKEGRIFKVIQSSLNDNNYTVISSTLDGDNTVITIDAELHAEQNGAISGAVFEPKTEGSQPSTYVATTSLITLPKDDNLHLTYYWVGAMHVDIDMVWDDAVKSFFPKDSIQIDGLLIENDKNETTPTTVAKTEILESVIWGWGTTQSWAITAVDKTKITLQGDLTNVFQDEITVVASDKNNGTYSIKNGVYDIATNTTTFTSPGTYFKKTGALGLVQLDNVDISAWFQFLIIEMKTSGTIKVQGNATGSIQSNQQIKAFGKNEGYYFITSAIFDGKNTILSTSTPISKNSKGGTVEPSQHLGMRLEFRDTIGVSIHEEIAGLSNNDSGPWDANQWDTNQWDDV